MIYSSHLIEKYVAREQLKINSLPTIAKLALQAQTEGFLFS
jgi:hypothetical protein